MKYFLIFIFLFGCTRPPQSAYKTQDGKTKQKYYNSLYLGDKNGVKKYGKKVNKKNKK